METVFTGHHKLRNSQTEPFGRPLVKPFDHPSHAKYSIDRIPQVDLGPFSEPGGVGMNPTLTIHDANFTAARRVAWSGWQAEGFKCEAIPTVSPAQPMPQRAPKRIKGRLGDDALACKSTVLDAVWEAAHASVPVTLTGADPINQDAHPVFFWCPPAGHRGTVAMYDGPCGANTAAITAQYLLDTSAERIAPFGVDFHQGDITQDVLDTRDAVVFASLDGNPMAAFPNFLGHTEETRSGTEAEFIVKSPLPPTTDLPTWRAVLKKPCAQIDAHMPDAVTTYPGFDIFAADSICFFKPVPGDDGTCGAETREWQVPTLSGFDAAEIGVTTINVLQGFEGAS